MAVTNTERIHANNAELRECIEIAENLPDAGTSAEIVLQSKAVTPTKNAQEITADADYTALEKVTVEAIPSEYIVPSGTKEITENGTHDAKAYESVNVNVPIPDGYIVPSGELEVTENGKHDVTDYASVNVNVPSNAPNIQPLEITENGTYTPPDGVDGFAPVTVNVEASGGGGDSEEEVAALLGNTMTELNNSIVTSLRTRACQGATKLVTVNLPMVTSTGSYAFYGCSGLVTVTLPKLVSVSTQTFYSCTKLQHADCGLLGNLPAQTFNACSALTELILRKTSAICTLSNVNAINNTPIGKGTGYVYVPRSLVDSYKANSTWATFEAQIRAIEDYPEICGV